jgi:hypothetical protein
VSVADRKELTPEDIATARLVDGLIESGNLQPLIERLRTGVLGPERARDVLRALGDYDRALLVQISLDTLIAEYLADPGAAHQPRRESRGSQD